MRSSSWLNARVAARVPSAVSGAWGALVTAGAVKAALALGARAATPPTSARPAAMPAMVFFMDIFMLLLVSRSVVPGGGRLSVNGAPVKHRARRM